MANAKQINQLNEAASLSAETKLAVANPNTTEAESATVSQLAQAVAELNETGAFAEQTLATSMGKNLLAQVLTNKGVETTSSETLIQMADKVNALNLSSDIENVYATMIASREEFNLEAGSGYLAFDINTKTKATIFYHNGFLHYIPWGHYSSYAEWWAAKTSSVAINIASYAGTGVGFSEDGSKVIVWTSQTAYSMYRIEDNTLVLMYEAANLSRDASSARYAISNDGQTVVYAPYTTSSSSTLCIYNHVGGQQDITLPTGMRSYNAIKIHSDKLYVICNNSSSARYLYEMDFIVSEDGIVTTSNQSSYSCPNLSGIEVVDDVVLLIGSTFTNTTAYDNAGYEVSFRFIELGHFKNGASAPEHQSFFFPQQTSVSSSITMWTSGENPYISYFSPFEYKKEDNSIIISSMFFDKDFVYDFQNNELVIVPDNYIAGLYDQVNNSNYFVYFDKSAMLGILCVTNSASNSVLRRTVTATISTAKEIKYKSKQLIGKKMTLPNGEEWWGMACVRTLEKVASGDFEINTEIVPAVPDEGGAE